MKAADRISPAVCRRARKKAVLKKAREKQKRYEFFFETGRLLAEHYKINTIEEARKIINPPPKQL